MTKRWTAALLVLPLMFSVAACGDDDDADDDAAPADASSGDDAQAVCEPFFSVLSDFNAEPSEESTLPKLDELEAVDAGEIEDDLQVIIDGARSSLETGDDTALETDEFHAAGEVVDAELYDTCDADEKIEVSAIDYGFEGIPDELDAGRVFFRLTNDTTHGEEHEIGIAKKKDGVTDSWDDILADPEASEDKVEFMGGAFAPEEGATAVAFTDLDAGEYIAVCFIPVGGAEEGQPHFMEGMRHEFTVS